MKINLLGIDLAKNVFQLCALNQANKILFNRSVRRAHFHSSIARLEPTTIAMEACSSAHFWGRTFTDMGHQVVLVPAQHVTPFVRSGKSDARDALAICEAARVEELSRSDGYWAAVLFQSPVVSTTTLPSISKSVGGVITSAAHKKY